MQVIDLVAVALSGEGTPIWTCETEDLNLNLVVLPADGAMAEHRNSEVDVLLVGVEGTGSVTVEGEEHELEPGRIIVVPKGARRSIASRGDRFAYLTCHRRRGGLWPAALPSRRLEA